MWALRFRFCVFFLSLLYLYSSFFLRFWECNRISRIRSVASLASLASLTDQQPRHPLMQQKLYFRHKICIFYGQHTHTRTPWHFRPGLWAGKSLPKLHMQSKFKEAKWAFYSLSVGCGANRSQRQCQVRKKILAGERVHFRVGCIMKWHNIDWENY